MNLDVLDAAHGRTELSLPAAISGSWRFRLACHLREFEFNVKLINSRSRFFQND
jgi:hypothetical protein